MKRLTSQQDWGINLALVLILGFVIVAIAVASVQWAIGHDWGNPLGHDCPQGQHWEEMEPNQTTASTVGFCTY